MKRLTYRLEDQNGNPTDSIILESDYVFMNTPEKLKIISSRLAAIEDILGDEYELDRLWELVEADREGRCVVLPAKTVFELTWDAGPECDMACPAYLDGSGECDFCDKGKLFVYERPCKQEHIERIGEDVFLTRSEAEDAMKAREQDG